MYSALWLVQLFEMERTTLSLFTAQVKWMFHLSLSLISNLASLFCLLHHFPIFIIAVLLVGVWVPSLTDPRRCWELHNHRFDCMFLIPCIHWVIRLCWHAICAIFKNWTQFFSHIWYVLVLSFLFILVLTVLLVRATGFCTHWQVQWVYWQCICKWG